MSIQVNKEVNPTSNATYTINMEVNAATLVHGGAGSSAGYHANDVLTVVGGTFTTAATITVNTVDGGGGILTYTLTNQGSYTVLPTNPVSTTVSPSGGTGATFNLTYDVKGISINTGGSGYGTTAQYVVVGGGYATQASFASSTTVSGVIPTGSLTVVSHGTGYTSVPTLVIDSVNAAEYVSKLNNRTVDTFQDHRYIWEFQTGGKLNSGSPGDLSYAIIQSNLGV